MKYLVLSFFMMLFFDGFCQKTVVYGTVVDASNEEPIPFALIYFQDAKVSTHSDSLGKFSFNTYYATDSIVIQAFGFAKKTIYIQKDIEQEIIVKLYQEDHVLEDVVIKPPDEFPSTVLHKKVIKNKPINNKEKLLAYEYELYNKIQLDVNNIGDKFTQRGVVQKLDLILDYIDSSDTNNTFLPVILSETVSNFYFKKQPKKKKEVIMATHTTGIENLQIDQFVGDMYLDINVYENQILLFNKSFISPLANYARTFYKFYLDDSTFIDNQWCYKLTFKPKRDGDLTFHGEMWIHDTTYAVKQISATISPGANINYVEDLYFEHHFQQVENEIWVLVEEKMIAKLAPFKETKLYGLYGRKYSSRKHYLVNQPHDDDFYKSDNTVEIHPEAKNRDKAFWAQYRHVPLNKQEEGINQMVDSLNNLPLFKTLKKLSYFASTGYYPFGKFEVGDATSFFSTNPVEQYRVAIALRTSNNFSKRIEFGGKLAYGFLDERLKFGTSIRYNITPKKRGMLTAYFKRDIEQIGQSPSASAVGSTFGNLFRTGPLDKLTFVDKIGINLEKDVKKDIILYGGFEWKEYTPLGLAKYVKEIPSINSYDTINQIISSEFIARVRWTKDEEFIAGSFDRSTLRSKYPIFALQGIFGVKGLFGSQYNYQKIEFTMNHKADMGVLGRWNYGVNAGYVFGQAAYPFLKVHEGNQSYWLLSSAFNKLNFFEFISDKYVGGYAEEHWGGSIFDRIPYVKKLKWRLVTTQRFTLGSISERSTVEMILPEFTKSFNYIPYVEIAVGIENIFKLGRIDLVWRVTHLTPDISPLGLRARASFNF
jgi:hypothetical protein